MSESRFGRREMLAGAGAAGALAVLGGLGNATVAKADDESHGLLGAYLITVTTAGGSPPPFKAIAGFAPNGLAINQDAQAPGNFALGAWDGSADGFEVRYIAFQFGPGGNNVGYIRIDVKGKLHGDSISGTFTVTFVPNSGPTQPAGNGTFSGKRLQV
jgi:hypothetical protein